MIFWVGSLELLWWVKHPRESEHLRHHLKFKMEWKISRTKLEARGRNCLSFKVEQKTNTNETKAS